MSCDCISDIEKRLADKFSADIGVDASARCESVGFLLSGGIVHYTNFKITAQAKGYARGKVVPVHSNYCPFCGKSMKDGVAA